MESNKMVTNANLTEMARNLVGFKHLKIVGVRYSLVAWADSLRVEVCVLKDGVEIKYSSETKLLGFDKTYIMHEVIRQIIKLLHNADTAEPTPLHMEIMDI